MKKRTLLISAGAAVVVVAGGAGTWWALSGTSSGATSTTYTVSTSTIQQTISATGTVEPVSSADLSFSVSGKVARVYVTAGQKVAVGQALASVDDTSLVSSRTAAAAQLTAAQSQLSTDSSGGASDTQLAADRGNVASAVASYENASDAVEEATLRATIAGTVDAVNVAVGDTVSGGSGSQQKAASSSSSSSGASSAAFSVVSTEAYEIDATVAASDVGSVKKGLQAQISVSGTQDTIYGTVSSVGLVAQTNSTGAAVFPVTIKVTGKPLGLYPGTSATSSIIVKQLTDVVAVPARALQTSGDTTYVVMSDGSHRTVQLGETAGGQTQVTSGLASGDVIRIPGFIRTGTTGGRGTGGTFGGGFGGGSFQPPAGFTGGSVGGLG